jgi:hypothetical protein
MSEIKVIKGPLKNEEFHVAIQCPECDFEGWIDLAQYEGRVSIVCKCGWHETHNLAQAEE